jgi:3-methyladenine DNA glycosylase/8-oxoguanine DNA glycosylase
MPPDPHAAAIEHLSASDERLAALIARVGPCQVLPRDPAGLPALVHFEGLVRAIVSQQLSGKAANTIFARVKALGVDDAGALRPDRLLAVPDEGLRGAGLSGQKARYVRDLADHVVRGALPLDRLHTLDDDAVIEALCQVKGVGRWTAEMVLIFQLGRTDVLPVADLGIRKGFQRLFGLRQLPEGPRMVKLARPFRPYRSIACWYLWRLTEEKVT